jgi:thioredoxin 1
MNDFLRTLFGKKDEQGEAALAVASKRNGAELAAAGEDGAGPIHISDDSFADVILKAPVPAMVDFWAPWCGPCRMVAPIVEDLARDYGERLVVAKINTDENDRVASEYGIMGIPTLILFRDGQEVDRVVGFAPRQVLQERLEAVLAGEG